MELKCSLTETESIADSHEQVLQSHCRSQVYRHGVQSLEAHGDHSNQDIMREDLHTMYNAHHALCTADLEGGHRIMHTTQG